MKLAALDLETTDLKALMGRVLCGCIYPIYNVPDEYLKVKPKVDVFRADDLQYNTGDLIDDSKLLAAIRDEVNKYNGIVTWNGKLFDLPFLNARLIHYGLRPCEPQFHIDLMYYAGGVSMRVGSRKLDNVQKFLRLVDEKTPITWEAWQRAAAGDSNAMDKVVAHCEKDVIVLAEAYNKMLPLIKNVHR